jgi:tryptophan synthase beta chain
MPMYTLGHDFVPPPVHAGGLRYHGDAPSLCGLVKAGVFEARAYPQTLVFESAVRFARAEGFVPGPEPAHAVKAVEDEALRALEADEECVILFNLSGHGHFDLGAFDGYLKGELQDYPLPDSMLEESLTSLPQQPEPR